MFASRYLRLLTAFASLLCALAATVCWAPIIYPEAYRDESVVDVYHGVQIKDPYRWLENPDSIETKQFIEAQNRLTRPILDSYPSKVDIEKRLTTLSDFGKYYTPSKKGNRYFYYKNDGLQNQNVLYVQDSLDGDPRVLLDPNTLSQDGTVAITITKYTDDGSILAYGLSASGSDWITIHFLDVETGKNYPEVLENVKFSSISWTKDNKGIFYARYPSVENKPDGTITQGNRDQKLFYHKLNTPQTEDVLVVEFPEYPLWRIGAQVSHDGRYLIINIVVDTNNNQVYYVDLMKYSEINTKFDLIPIIKDYNSQNDYITNEGSVITLRTNRAAPNFRLVNIDLDKPDEENWTTLIPENERDVMDWATPVDGDKLVIGYIRDVKSALELRKLASGELLHTFDLETGTVEGFSGSKYHSEIFYKFVSFLVPGKIYHMDLKKQPYSSHLYKETKVKNLDTSNFEIEQVFYPSKDGTQVPMFIVHKKGIIRDGSNPTLIYGYGGFGVSLQPSFSVMRIVFMENFNGIIAIPNIRGGGEYGRHWHDNGKAEHKQNSFDDFQAAAEYLIHTKYTRPPHIVIQGGSNGGLLIAACINQRPDLYAAALVQVGVLDMLRYHKFTIGYAWISDYGNPDNETDFKNIIKFSPLHNVHTPKDARSEYPATLVMTADHDDRVVPLHSLKFIAALQHAVKGSRQRRPLLARIDTKAGHGGGKPVSKIIAEGVDMLSFAAQSLGIQYKQ